MKSSAEDSLRLSKIFGITSHHNSNIATCSSSEGIFYAAGNVAVHYFPNDNEQKGFFQAPKAISSICVSLDGRFLAVGERGHVPSVIIWDIVKNEKLTALTGHKHGVGCMKFSPDGRYLVTVGFKPDKQLFLWDWKANRKLSTQRLGNKVYSISFHMFGDYFVTGGDRHLKWWTISEVLEGEAICLEGKPASIIEDQKNSIFVDVACGSYHYDGKLYCITSTGNLGIFNEDRMVEKWISLSCKVAYSLELFLQKDSPGLVVVGGSNGIIQAFSPKNLDLLADFPLPPALISPMKVNDVVKYPAVYGVRQIHGTNQDPVPKLCAIYANHSMQFWDISDLYQIRSFRAMQYHHACIWDLQCLDNVTFSTNNTMFPPALATSSHTAQHLPEDTFITCSSDNSIRFWNPYATSQKEAAETNHTGSTASSMIMNPTGEMIHSLQLASDCKQEEDDDNVRNSRVSIADTLASTATGLSLTHDKQEVAFDYSMGIPDLEIPDRIQSTFSPRTLAIHPWGHQLVCGDKSGKLLFYNLHTMELVKSIQAHSAEILTLAYCSPLITYDEGRNWNVYNTHIDAEQEEEEGNDGEKQMIVLLATAGRDRLIHLFNTLNPEVDIFTTNNKKKKGTMLSSTLTELSNYCHPIDTLDHHTSSVTMIKFTADGKKMISTSGDHSIIIYSVNGMFLTKLKSIPTPLGTINGLVIDVTNKFLVTSGSDKKITIWNLHSGKSMRSYKHTELLNNELYKLDLDSSGSYLLTCSFNKQISLLDFFSGEIITQIMDGHSEMITNVKFSSDSKQIISISGDGCIAIWSLNKMIIKTMKDRLIELYTNAQRKNTRAMIRQSSLLQNTTLSTPIPAITTTATESKPSNVITTIGTNATNGANGANGIADNGPPKGSLDQLKSKLSNRSNTNSSINSSTTTSTTSTNTSGVKKVNRWEMKLQQDAPNGAYELFGKKIVSSSEPPIPSVPAMHTKNNAKLHNKFTLELTSSVLPPPPPSISEIASSNMMVMMNSPKAKELEATDMVRHAMSLSSSSNDSEEDDEDVFNVDFEESEQSEAATVVATAAVEEEKVNMNVNMDKSGKDLENWLEDMIRNETKLDDHMILPTGSVLNDPIISSTPLKPKQSPYHVSNSSIPSNALDDDHPLDLNQSLSSAFFSNLNNNKPRQLPPNTPPAAATADTAAVVDEAEKQQLLNDRKLRESASMMAHMKERLRVMNDDDANGNTNGNSNAVDEQQLQQHQHMDLNASIEILQTKTIQYKHVLRDLQQAKAKANASYQELLQLRNSMSFPPPASSASYDMLSSSAHYTSSLSEAEELLQAFHDTLMMSPIHPNQSSQSPSLSTSTSTTVVTLREEDMMPILEKYSDRLLDLMMKKLSN